MHLPRRILSVPWTPSSAAFGNSIRTQPLLGLALEYQEASQAVRVNIFLHISTMDESPRKSFIKFVSGIEIINSYRDLERMLH